MKKILLALAVAIIGLAALAPMASGSRGSIPHMPVSLSPASDPALTLSEQTLTLDLHSTQRAAVRKFVESDNAGTYTATVQIPAGGWVLDVRWVSQNTWASRTSVVLNVGDTEDADGYFANVDLKTAPYMINGAGGLSSFKGDPGSGAYGGLTKYGPTLITATVITEGTGDQGISYLIVLYAAPSSLNATKVVR